VYKLDGNKSHPIEPKVVRMSEAPPKATGSDDDVQHGSDLYIEHCARCHGLAVGVPGALPDLRYMSPATHQIFDAIVLDGVLSSVGMVGFDHLLSKKDADDLHHYLTAAANEVWSAQNSEGWWQSSKDWVLRKTGEAIGFFMSD
jgi:quinohemoprotein ethanol dehydrogenase